MWRRTLRLGLLVREEYDAGDEDDHCAENEEKSPRLIGIDFVIEDLNGKSVTPMAQVITHCPTNESRKLRGE